MNDGNSALSLTSITFTAPNGTTTNVGSGNSATFLGHVGCWTPDAFRWQGGNVKANSTTFCLSGTGSQTFSFRLQSYAIGFYARPTNGLQGLTDFKVWLDCAFVNGTTSRTGSNNSGYALRYLTNGTHSCRVWWNGTSTGTTSIIVNETASNARVDYSFTNDVTVQNITTRVYTYIHQGFDHVWGVGINRTAIPVSAEGWVQAANELRLGTITSSSRERALVDLRKSHHGSSAAPAYVSLAGIQYGPTSEYWGGLSNGIFSFDMPFDVQNNPNTLLSWSAVVVPPGGGDGGGGGGGPVPIVQVQQNVTQPLPPPSTIAITPEQSNFAFFGLVSLVAIVTIVLSYKEIQKRVSPYTMWNKKTKNIFKPLRWKKKKIWG